MAYSPTRRERARAMLQFTGGFRAIATNYRTAPVSPAANQVTTVAVVLAL
jgi:hypothetical protein